MFTGITQQTSGITSVGRRGRSLRLSIDLGLLADGVRIGDSIMIDGVCLTVAALSDAVAHFDVAPETIGLTTLNNATAGRRVNVEPAMRPDDRFGGHFVSGHVDGTGRIVAMTASGGETRMRIRTDAHLTARMIPKGSVCVSGISLTLAALDDGWFECSLIPHTLRATTLATLSIGSEVNIECDMIGKWVFRFLSVHGPGRAGGSTDPGVTAEYVHRILQDEPNR